MHGRDQKRVHISARRQHMRCTEIAEAELKGAAGSNYGRGFYAGSSVHHSSH